MPAAMNKLQSFQGGVINRIAITLLALLLFILAQSALAKGSFKAFERDSLAGIEQARQGQAFVLVLWSIDCPPCLHELKLLSQLRDSGLEERLILVSTDGADYRDDLEKLIALEQLSGYEHWLFNDVLPERLRYSIDPAWYGELPRAYFYDEQGERIARSGVLTEELLMAWLSVYLKK